MSSIDFIERDPVGFISTDAVDDQGDIVLIPIDEWKKRYGQPGDGKPTDINGRINGYFPTEPDYCESANELVHNAHFDENEQAGDAA